MKFALMRSMLLLFLAFSLVFTSCHKKESSSGPVSGDYLVIGWTGGFVGYASHNYYLIANGKVSKDVSTWSTSVPVDISQFVFTGTESTGKYDSIKDLVHNIPSELLSENNADIGLSWPDAGFTDIRTSIKGINYRWTFEADQSHSSLAIQQFVTNAKVVFQ